ncbi:MAG: signal peptidase II [Clostridiales bacterium]|nr:signal peptidase II [Clostridiales bacterium]
MEETANKRSRTDVRGLLTWTLLAVFVTVADYVSKRLIVRYLMPVGSVTVIPGIFDFTYLENRGAAFGMLEDHPWIHTAISLAAVIGISVYLVIERKAKRSQWLNAAAGMMIGGGIGNLIDRLSQGYVVDFIETKFMKFAIFNVADSFVTVGAAILLVYVIVSEIKTAKKQGSDG